MEKRNLLLLLLALAYPLLLPAQDTLDPGAWLQQRRQALGLDRPAGPERTFRASWIDEIELRTETEDFDLAKEEYLFRFSPSTFRIRRAQSRLVELAREEGRLSRSEFAARATRYLLEELFAIRRLQAELPLQRRLQAVYGDERTLISGLLEEGEYDLQDLLQIEAQLQKIELDLHDQEFALQLWAEDGALPQTESLIAIRTIAGQLGTAPLPTGDYRDEELKRARLQTEVELEKAERNRILDFLQVRYNGPHSDLLAERLNVGLGIQLPFSGSSKLKLEELRVEQLQHEQELQQDRTLDSLRLRERLRDLRLLTGRWQQLSGQIEAQTRQWESLRSRGLDVAFDSPELLLFQEEALLKKRLALLELEDEIYRAYLALLDQTGLLITENPVRDLLPLRLG